MNFSSTMEKSAKALMALMRIDEDRTGRLGPLLHTRDARFEEKKLMLLIPLGMLAP
jgi:hypothetical protein